MRMVEADDSYVSCSRVPPGVDVILRIDQESVEARREVAGPADLGHGVRGSKQKAAALGRCALARVGDDGVEHGSTDDHNASTTIAMPMPPPMHSEATP